MAVTRARGSATIRVNENLEGRTVTIPFVLRTQDAPEIATFPVDSNIVGHEDLEMFVKRGTDIVIGRDLQ